MGIEHVNRKPPGAEEVEPQYEAERGTCGPDPEANHVAFNLGWDLAYYGIACDIEDPQVRQGYLAGKERFLKGDRRSADRFTRKWLLLRTNAWRRGRVFSESVTPEYLRRIDVKLCPITGILLTYGTGLETDASIDRVNNDGAYAQGNLAVMSVRANRAKGQLSFTQVLERISAQVDAEGLTAAQWLRLGSLMEGPCSFEASARLTLPFSLPAICGLRVTRAQALQFVLRLEAHNYRNVHVIRPIRKTCLVIADRKGFDGLIKRLRKRRQAGVRVQDFWWNDSLFSAFARWYENLNPVSLANIEGVLLARAKYSQRRWDLQTWCLDSLGYYETADDQEAQAEIPAAPSDSEAA